MSRKFKFKGKSYRKLVIPVAPYMKGSTEHNQMTITLTVNEMYGWRAYWEEGETWEDEEKKCNSPQKAIGNLLIRIFGVGEKP